MLVYDDKFYEKNESVIEYNMEEEAILHDTLTKNVHVINDLGWFIWMAISENDTCNLETIEHKVLTAFSQCNSNVLDDIRAFIDDLIDKNLLTAKCN